MCPGWRGCPEGRRWARPRLEQGKRFLFLTPQALRTVEGYFEHYGTLTILFARFVAGLRVVAALPRTATGQVQRRLLVERLASG